MTNIGIDSGFLTTHVLDTARGCPAEGIKIRLFRISGDYDFVLMVMVKPIVMGDCQSRFYLEQNSSKGLINLFFMPQII